MIRRGVRHTGSLVYPRFARPLGLVLDDRSETPRGKNVKEMQNRRDKPETRPIIRLIGAFSVIGADGKDCPISGKKDRAVLAFLAAHPGRPIARERLVELIWPDAAEGAGRASLRQSLSSIRKQVPAGELLSSTRDTVAFNADAAETDILGLAEVSAPKDLADGIPGLGGEMFLDDLSGISAEFDTWRATEQSRVQALVRELLEELAQKASVAKDTNKFVAALSHLVALNPLDEDAQRRHMLALIGLGQVNAAIRQYRRLEQILNRELGTGPDEATRSIFSEARAKLKQGTDPDPETSPLQTPEVTDGSRVFTTVYVHPFRNLSQGSDDANFAKALSDSIAAALSQISGLNVFAGPSAPVSTPITPARSPNAGRVGGIFALQGTVRAIGSRLRVGARLLERETGRIYWAEDYDRELGDVFSVQDDITHKIAVEMRIKLSEGEKIRVLEKYTENVEVWTRLMKADVLVNSLVEEKVRDARRLLKEAIQIDPACFAVWGELADAYVAGYMMGWNEFPGVEYLDRAMKAAEKALQIEPGFTHALNVISLVQSFRGEFDLGIETSRRALAQAPRNPEIAANCAYALVICGQVEEASQIIRSAIDATPIPPMWYLTVDGICEFMMGSLDHAISRLREAVVLVPDSAFARLYLIAALTEAGLTEEAKKIAAEISQVQPDFSLARWPGVHFAAPGFGKRLAYSISEAGVSR